MKRIFWCIIVSFLFLNINTGIVYGVDLDSEEDIKELRKKIFGGFDISLSGIARIEATLENRFGQLTGIGGRATSAATDETFYDFRSYLTAKIKKERVSLVISADIAGDDFSDPAGGIFGNALDDDSSAGGPAVTRDSNWDLRIRHLFLNYNGFVNFTVGRQHAKVAHGIMVNTIRDSAKVVKSFGNIALAGVVVKGGETFPNAVSSDSLGENDNDLDAYLAFGKYKYNNGSATLGFAIQDDTRKDKGFPEKQYLLLIADGSIGNLYYQLDGIYYGGETPFNSSKGKRLRNRAWLGYGKLQYKLPDHHSLVGIAIGYGSGDNNSGDNKQSDFQSLFMNNNGFQIANIYGNDIHGYDSYRAGTTGSDGNNAGSGFANTTFFQISVENQPVSNLNIEGVFTYFKASKSQLVGEGVLLHANDGTASTGETERSNNIGWEADLNLNYQIQDGFSFYTRLGYFSSGKIWGNSTPSVKKAQGGLMFNF